MAPRFLGNLCTSGLLYNVHQIWTNTLAFENQQQQMLQFCLHNTQPQELLVKNMEKF